MENFQEFCYFIIYWNPRDGGFIRSYTPFLKSEGVHKVEYFGMVLTILLGIAFFLTPMPEIKNMKLKLIAKASRSFCITISIILTIYYYIFTMEQIYGEQIHLEVWRGLLIIYGALFRIIF